MTGLRPGWRAWRGAFAGVALLLAAACEREPTRIELPVNEVIVQSVLVAGDDSVRLRLTRARYEAAAGYVTADPVDGALIELLTDAGSVILVPAPPGERCTLFGGWWVHDDPAIEEPGCHVAALPGGVVPGAEYGLRVVMPDGALVRGRARVPAMPAVPAPAQASRFAAVRVGVDLITEAPIPVAWSTGSAAAAVDLTARVATFFIADEARTAPGCLVVPHGHDYLEPGDGSRSWPLTVQTCVHHHPLLGPQDPDSLAVQILVVAVDSAYARYPRDWSGQSVRRADVSVNLEGAVGLFAGIAPVRRSVILYVRD